MQVMRMKKNIKMQIWVCFLLTALCCCVGARAQETTPPPTPSELTDTAPQPATDTLSAEATPEEFIEVTAYVVKVATDSVYIDQGGMHGVVPGLTMRYYDRVEIRDLGGNVIGVDEKQLGELKVIHVYEAMCEAEVASSEKPPQRGMVAKYFAPAPPEDADQQYTTCPPDMQFVEGGPFAFRPASPSASLIIDQSPRTAEVDGYCVDVDPHEKKLNWTEARDFCGAQGKHLCMRDEQHKTCALHNRPPPCHSPDPLTGQCPRGQAVRDFGRDAEWSAAWLEEGAAGDTYSSIGSCACMGSSPSCYECGYPGCPKARKKFRCCKRPE